MTPDDAEKLRAPFPADKIGELPRGGTLLGFVGHGWVTDRLLEVDPEWTWEPLAYDEQGLPAFVRDQSGQPYALWIRLTVCGTSRIEVGTVDGGVDREKQLVSDAIRRAAMRFGVALDLWTRGDPDAPVPIPAPSGFESHAEWERVVVETRELAASLPADVRDVYRDWFAGQGFVQLWDRIDCDRMLAKITELSTREMTPADIVGGPG